tara:strand:- start:46 stop:210 length:165 start_codon:yes stop_codon:yes gene_type:complete
MKEKKEEVQEVQEVVLATMPVVLVNAILQYLSTKPYGEVTELVTKIQSDTKVSE